MKTGQTQDDGRRTRRRWPPKRRKQELGDSSRSKSGFLASHLSLCSLIVWPERKGKWRLSATCFATVVDMPSVTEILRSEDFVSHTLLSENAYSSMFWCDRVILFAFAWCRQQNGTAATTLTYREEKARRVVVYLVSKAKGSYNWRCLSSSSSFVVMLEVILNGEFFKLRPKHLAG